MYRVLVNPVKLTQPALLDFGMPIVIFPMVRMETSELSNAL